MGASKAARKVKVYTDLDIGEVSGVDRPAQEGARVVQKRAPIATAIVTAKGVCMTRAEKDMDHSHLIQGHDDMSSGYTSSADSEHGWHQHPWMKTPDGKIIVGKARGHSHAIIDDPEDLQDMGADEDEEDASGSRVRKFASLDEYIETCKRKYTADQLKEMVDAGEAMQGGRYPIKDGKDLEDAIHAWGRTPAAGRAAVANWIKRRARALDMTDKLPTAGKLAEALGTAKRASNSDNGETPMAMTEAEKLEFEKAKKDAAHWRAMAEMPVEEREYAKRLDSDARVIFVSKSAKDRAAELAADEVVYTATDGRIFRKSHPVDLVTLAKAADEAKAQAATATKQANALKFAKRADEEIPHLAGSAEVRGQLIEHIETSLPKEAAEQVIASLKSASVAAKKAFETFGHNAAPAANSAEGRYNEARKNFATERKIDLADADEAFLNTKEGRDLKAAYDAERYANMLRTPTMPPAA